MRVLMLDTQGSGVGYYRFKVPHSALRDKISIDYQCLPETTAKSVESWIFDTLGNGYDLLHVGYLTHLPYIEACVAAREKFGVPFIADIDDDIYNVPSYNRAFNAYHRGAQERKMARLFLRISDAVSVSTEQLADRVKQDCRNCTVLPNALQPVDWKSVGQLEDDDSIRLMFAGNIGRYGDLLVVQEAVERLMAKHDNLRLFFVNCAPDWAAKWMRDDKDQRNNRAFFIRRCAVPTYQAVFNWVAPHIVFAPVQENKFNKSKSHIKAYDAAMCGAAFICSDWPTYANVPKGAALKVDNTTTQWEESLEVLLKDSKLRSDLNRKLKTWALDDWHIDNHVEKWVDLYERVHAAGPITELAQTVRPGVR